MLAKTILDANSQQYIPGEDLHVWAKNLDGYEIAKELGFDLKDWGAAQEENFHKTGTWNLNELEVRLMLFYIGRWLHFSGYTYREKDDVIESLLILLRQFRNLDAS